MEGLGQIVSSCGQSVPLHTIDPGAMNVPTVLDQAKASVLPVAAVTVPVVLALGVAGAAWWRRRRAHAGARGGAPSPADPDGTALGRALGRSWRRFRRGLPRPARRSLDDFHPAIVLGPESAGKEQLIERFGGVAQRRVELGGAAEVDGPLRIRLGGDVVVFDVAEEVVRAPRELVAPGLRRALGPVVRQRRPLVVVCLSPEALGRDDGPKLAELGRALRANLDLVSELRDEALDVRVVLSAAGGAGRFDALFRLLAVQGIPAVLPLEDPGPEALRATLLRYADELGTALIRLEPQVLLELVGFLGALPRLSSALSLILAELFAPGGDLTPRPDGLYLVRAEGGPDPLDVPESIRRPGPSPLLAHRLVALTAAALAVAGLAAAYRRDSAAWATAAAAARSYELSARNELDLRLAIRAYTTPLGSGAARLGFFAGGPGRVACAFVGHVRSDFLVDRLGEVLATPAAQRRPEHALFLAALLYASRDDGLGHLVQDRLDDFAAAVGLERSLLSDYLHLARPYRDRTWIDRLRDLDQGASGFDVERLVPRFLTLLAKDRVVSEPEVEEIAALARQLRGAWGYGAARRVLEVPPLDALGGAFRVHAPRFNLLAELSHNRIALEAIRAAVLDAAAPAGARRPRGFAELVSALTPLVAETDAGTATAVTVGGVAYPVDPGAYVRTVRRREASRLLNAFLDGLPADGMLALFFTEEALRQEIRLALEWPAGVAGARAQRWVFSREAFDGAVRPGALAVDRVIRALDLQPSEQDRLREALGAALEDYAAGYGQELGLLCASFQVTLTSDAAAQRVLRALSGRRSPLRELLRVVARNGQLGLGAEQSHLFDGLLDVEERFGGLAAAFEAGKAGEPFVAYEDILRGVLDALGETTAPGPGQRKPGPDGDPAGAGAATEAPGPADAGWSSRLSPLGRIALAALAGGARSALDAVEGWIGAAALPEEVARPLRAPLHAVVALGARDVERSLARWSAEVERALDADVFGRFPFDRRAADEAEPEAVADWLHPKRGRVATAVLPQLAGVVVKRPRGLERALRHEAAHRCPDGGVGVCLEVPDALLGALDRAASFGEVLWDDTGKPRPLTVKITPRPFTLGAAEGPAPELVRLSAGDASVLYFNQRPRQTVLAVDWTKDQVSALEVQLKDDGGGTATPPALVFGETPWSFFRLLERAERRGSTYTFRLRIAPTRVIAVSYEVKDPLEVAVRAPGAVAREVAR